MEHKTERLVFIRVRRCIPSSAFIHEQRTVLKPAPVRAENKINISANQAVFEILPAAGQRSVFNPCRLLRTAGPAADIRFHIGQPDRSAEQRILMSNQSAVPPYTPVSGRVNRYGLSDLPAVSGVIHNSQVFDGNVFAGSHHRSGKKGALLRSVFITVLRAAVPGDYCPIPVFSLQENMISMNHNLFPVFPGTDQNLSACFRKRVDSGLNTGIIAASVFCHNHHIILIPLFCIVPVQLQYIVTNRSLLRQLFVRVI